jgi:Glucose-repressible protein Grg1
LLSSSANFFSFLRHHPRILTSIAFNQIFISDHTSHQLNSSTMDFVKDKVNQVSETIQGKGAEASAEQNKRKFTRDSFQVVLY